MTRLLKLGSAALVAGATALACCAVFAGAAWAAPGGLKVLIAASDGAHTEAMLKGQIEAQPGVAQVDTFDAAASTPTIAQLLTYDAVVTYSNTDYADPATLGDRLSELADVGRPIVELNFDWSDRAQRRLEGRWATAGYSAFTATTQVLSTPATLVDDDTSSPLLAGVASLGSELRENVSLAGGAVELARWSDAVPAVAFNGNAIGVNACASDGCGGASGDIGRLIVNAASLHAVGQLFAPDKACQPDTFLQTGVATRNPYTVVAAGVVTSWYFQAADPPLSGLELKIGEPLEPPDFAAVAASPGGAQTPNQINGPYPARIPVRPGDLLGIFTDGVSGLCAQGTGNGADTYVFAAGDVGSTTTIRSAAEGVRFPVEAVVEPDLDGDGFGDVSQDRCPGASGPDHGCQPAPGEPGPAGGTPPAPTGPAPPAPPGVAPPASAPPPQPTASAAALVSNVTQTHRRWREPARATLAHVTRAVPVGTTFRFSLYRAAQVRLDFIRDRRDAGSLRLHGHTGTNTVRFLGNLTRSKRLLAGSYTLIVTATAPARGSTSEKLSFTIVR